MAQRERRKEPVRELAQRQKQRITTPATVTVIDLTHLGDCMPDATIHPVPLYRRYGLFACVACAWIGDWCILWGIIATGYACFVLGRGTVTFQHPEPAPDAPPGDGILWAAENAVVVIRGSERAVNTITRGRFFLQYDVSRRTSSAHPPDGGAQPATKSPPANGANPANGAQDGVGKEDDAKREPDSAPEGGAPNSLLIGISGILLVVQFFAQLLFIPQVGSIGQVMFLLTVVASWVYNVLTSSIDREDIQVRILRGPDILNLPKKSKSGATAATGGENGENRRRGERVLKFEFGTWTAVATFACLALRPDPATPLESLAKILDALIPNDTDTWVQCKELVNEQLNSKELGELAEPEATAPKLLKSIIGDARVAFQRYRDAFPVLVQEASTGSTSASSGNGD